MNKQQYKGQRVKYVISFTNKLELVVMKSKGNWSVLYFFSCLGTLNNLSMQKPELSKYMYSDCLNLLCFIYFLPAHINAAYKNFM